MDRGSQRKAYVDLTSVIRASEEWHPSYRSDRQSFRELVRQEAELQTAAGEYLFELSDRVHTYVDWSVYNAELATLPKVTAASKPDPVRPASDEAWRAEALDFTRYVIDIINVIALIGVDAAIKRYANESTVVSGDLLDLVTEQAEKHVGTLVTAVTDTTREKIRLAIAQSLRRGETSSQAMLRLRDVINSPVRAEMIAQTESVNAYSLGQYEYAKDVGFTKKTWESLAGACPKKCLSADGQTVDIEDDFILGDGSTVKLPSGHTRCRCGVYFHD
ncbi:hypothetical protein HWD35_10390 [Tsukamurella tyrosinosolvens]|uniref:phage minor head protein n=1 Tax=Tsukamurella tyrosinosolvens TaxID=57704 RepID=UPI001CE205B9|nr:phage minor head protein [Tsukamurella tyrosinosolvens]MCA4995120.1 hypothetical protein [Tsukamurella tyrosinosolvens]